MFSKETLTIYSMDEINPELKSVGITSPGIWEKTSYTTDSGSTRIKTELLSVIKDRSQPITSGPVVIKYILDEIFVKIKNNIHQVTIKSGLTHTIDTLITIPDEYKDNTFFIWEQSKDGSNWESIVSENLSKITVKPEEKTFYRLKVTAIGLSGIVYSPTVEVDIKSVVHQVIRTPKLKTQLTSPTE